MKRVTWISHQQDVSDEQILTEHKVYITEDVR